MKKIFTLMIVALALVAVNSATAQTLKLGLKGGVSTKTYEFSSFSLDGATISTGANGNVGYQLGLAMKISLPKFLYFQPELMYEANDFDYVITTSSSSSKVRMDVQRFALPIMVGFNIRSLRFFGGPKFILASSSTSSNQNLDFKVDYVDTNVAVVLGCGFDIKNFFIDVSYTTYMGVNNDKFYYNDDYARVNVKTDSQWNFNVGFFF